MRPHHELVFWFKCPICGFTDLDYELLSPNEQKNATRNKWAKLGEIDSKIWKPWLDDEED